MAQPRTRELLYPPHEVFLITPSNSTEYDPPLKMISVGTVGAVKVDTAGGSSAVIIPANALAKGVQHHCQITKVYATDTTASEIVGWR